MFKHILICLCGLSLPIAGGCGFSHRGSIPLVTDLDGNNVALPDVLSKVVVVVTMRTDCPIANRYAPTIRSMVEYFDSQPVTFALLYPTDRETNTTIRQHLAEYMLAMAAYRDPEHQFVSQFGLTVTPEAVVFNRRGDVAYRGRIDNRFVQFGQARAEATEHDLREAIDAALSQSIGEPIVTEAIGCYIQTRS